MLCVNCPWWVKDSGRPVGSCYLNPPVVNPTGDLRRSGSRTIDDDDWRERCVRPKTSAEDFCKWSPETSLHLQNELAVLRGEVVLLREVVRSLREQVDEMKAGE